MNMIFSEGVMDFDIYNRLVGKSIEAFIINLQLDIEYRDLVLMLEN